MPIVLQAVLTGVIHASLMSSRYVRCLSMAALLGLRGIVRKVNALTAIHQEAMQPQQSLCPHETTQSLPS